MKKQILISLFTLFSISSYAQLRVDSLGTTHTDTLQSNFIRLEGDSTNYGKLSLVGDATIQNVNNTYCALNLFQTGTHQSTNSNDISVKGINVDIYEGSQCQTAGIRTVCHGGGMAYGLFAGINVGTSSTWGSAGVYGSSIGSWAYMSGRYAGYFYGNVKATGTIYGTLVSPSSVSSPSNGSGETTVLSTVGERGNSVTGKLQNVDILQMERINQDGSLPANKAVKDIDEDEAPIQTKLSAVSYGLAADQLQKVYPELVYEDAEGNYSINYIEMVPLLVQSIKELSAKVTSLEQQLGIAEKAEVKAESEETDDIALVVPEGAKDATLSFFDLSGKQVRTARVKGASSNAKTYTRGLPSGAYVCTLVVDGQVRSSRKMVVK